MRTLTCLATITFASFALVAIVACGKKDDQPQAVAPQQQGYPQQAPAGSPPPQTTGAPAGQPGQMATPGPLALPCSNDTGCGLAHCNVQFQKCAFPCQSEVDCIQGATCNSTTGFCLPKAGGQ